MVRPIARNTIARLGVAGTPIATVAGSRPQPQPFVYPAGSYTFTTPYSGYWKFVLWGLGGGTGIGSGSGASGAYSEITRYLRRGETVALSVNATTATFADGYVVTAGAASAGVAGVASGGDLNLNGSAGTVTGNGPGLAGAGSGGGAGGAGGSGAGGAGAPAVLPFRGGAGGLNSATSSAPGHAPGGGSGETSTAGGDGMAVVLFVRD